MAWQGWRNWYGWLIWRFSWRRRNVNLINFIPIHMQSGKENLCCYCILYQRNFRINIWNFIYQEFKYIRICLYSLLLCSQLWEFIKNVFINRKELWANISWQIWIRIWTVFLMIFLSSFLLGLFNLIFGAFYNSLA